MSGAAQRGAEAERLLAQSGIRATVSAAGPTGEIAAVAAPVYRLADIAACAAAIRALGFRYVAIEIGPAGRGDPAAS